MGFSYLGAVDIYPPPYRGNPGRTCTVRGDMGYFGALDGRNEHLYVGNGVAVYSYPDCTYRYFIKSKVNNYVGIAVDPQSGS
ncbi:MAG TPA: hypothetical protein VHX17_02110 [Candidatus Cybelea sp.]|nr:hypothetical protein [Candidatus Cybelea sp.]